MPQTLFPHPNTKPAHYSTQHGRLKHMFSVFQLYITRGKRTPFARGASWVSLHLQTARKFILTHINKTLNINEDSQTYLENIYKVDQPFFSPFPSKVAILGEP